MISTRVSVESLNKLEVIASLAYLSENETDPDVIKAHAAQIQTHAVELGQFLRSVTSELFQAGR